MTLKAEIIRGDELTLDIFIASLSSYVPATAQIIVDGKVYSQPDLLKKADEMRAPLKTVRTINTELKKARLDARAKRSDIHVFVKALQTGMKSYLGEQNPDIEKFGFKADKRKRALTAEESASRAEKARMTREMRHTMGKRQKASIKAGDVAQTPPPPPPSFHSFPLTLSLIHI